MNRIILIGNGFDKASNLKTAYEDFILWYFTLVFEEKLVKWDKENGVYQDSLIRITRCSKPKDFINTFKECESLVELGKLPRVYIQDYSPSNHNPKNPVRIIFVSSFLKEIFKSQSWGEIEGEYFKALYRLKVKVYDRNKPYSYEHKRKEDIERLNKEFEFIRKTFSKYIKEVDERINFEEESAKKFKFNFIKKCLNTPNEETLEDYFLGPNTLFTDKPKEYFKPNTETLDKRLNNVVFINFNYTTNLNKQLFKFQGDDRFSFNLDEIRIHGNIAEDDERGIIFGYGDDTAKEYREIEQDGNNEYLRFMKSTQYFHDDNYKRIVSYIEEEQFELFLAGHSLSLSDRVLLKTIVENENCKMIRFFHKGNYEDYRMLVGSMTRHFDDKIKMRDKFLPYDKSDTIS
ncbi:MAG: AbiH family protein [Vicingaceae bacterium]